VQSVPKLTRYRHPAKICAAPGESSRCSSQTQPVLSQFKYAMSRKIGARSRMVERPRLGRGGFNQTIMSFGQCCCASRSAWKSARWPGRRRSMQRLQVCIHDLTLRLAGRLWLGLRAVLVGPPPRPGSRGGLAGASECRLLKGRMWPTRRGTRWPLRDASYLSSWAPRDCNRGQSLRSQLFLFNLR
jgi:hypothetical protein